VEDKTEFVLDRNKSKNKGASSLTRYEQAYLLLSKTPDKYKQEFSQANETLELVSLFSTFYAKPKTLIKRSENHE
jgi:hypothetical protein